MVYVMCKKHCFQFSAIISISDRYINRRITKRGYMMFRGCSAKKPVKPYTPINTMQKASEVKAKDMPKYNDECRYFLNKAGMLETGGKAIKAKYQDVIIEYAKKDFIGFVLSTFELDSSMKMILETMNLTSMERSTIQETFDHIEKYNNKKLARGLISPILWFLGTPPLVIYGLEGAGSVIKPEDTSADE